MYAMLPRVLGAVLLVPCLLVAQRTIYVDGSNPRCPGTGSQANPFCTIQLGINAASNGDTVLVLPGIYRERIDFLGKAIAVRGADGPRTTIIDAAKAGSGVTFRRGEGAKSVLEGFTVRNGTGTLIQVFTLTRLAGGGILCEGASPTISNVRLTNNTAQFGGGICGVRSASPWLDRVVMTGNTATPNGGGACFMFSCKPLLTGCIFSGNRCNHTGGALNFRNDSFPVLANCVFDNNRADDMGGAIRAGALSGCTLVHCTFFQNSSRFGGAVAAGSDTSGAAQTTRIRNCIFWLGTANFGPELSLNGRFPAIIDIAHSDVRGGQINVYRQNGFTLNWGAGMLGANPAFVDGANGDFHLLATSPCRNRGINVASGLQKTDFEGDPRIANTTTDMGADEFFPHLYHSGDPSPGAKIAIRIIGQPANFAIWLAAPLPLDPPVPVPGFGGLLHLDPRGMIVVPLGSFPPPGLVAFSFTFPPTFPRLDVPTQALSSLHFTNSDRLQVR